MSSYVTLTLHTHMYDEILEDLISYCSNLDDYWDMRDSVHLIDALEKMYSEDMVKQNKELQQWNEYEQLFLEHFENDEFRDNDGNINEKGMYEYKNFNKVNKVLKDYIEGGTLDILDSKQNFCLVLDLLNAMKD